jgi:hypothetical protein
MNIEPTIIELLRSGRVVTMSELHRMVCSTVGQISSDVTRRAVQKLVAAGTLARDQSEATSRYSLLPTSAKRGAVKPDKFSDSFTTEEATFSVDVDAPHGTSAEAVIVKIDCGGSIHGDEGLIDLLVEMLQAARENLVARRGKQRTARAKTGK